MVNTQGDPVGGDKINVGDIEGVGIAIGTGASVNIYGDVHYYPIKLRAPLREVFDPLLDDRTGLFAGRDAVLARIGEFIQDPIGGYLMITAPAGFGKTALVANLVSHTPEAFAYHFFTSIYVTDGLSEDFFLRNVVEQLAQWHDHKGMLPGTLHELSALYHKFLDEPLERTQVLVLDGLDEITTWNLNRYLSRGLPPNLHIILTVRDVGQDWAREYGLAVDQIKHLPLAGLNQDEVGQVLRAAGQDAVVFAEDPLLLNEVMRISAYQADEALGADPFYVRLLAEDAAEGRLTPDNVAAQPQGLDAYLDTWWQEVKKLAGDQPARDLFGTLAVALGPIPRVDLEAINPSLVDEWAEDFFEDVLNQVRRWVVGDAIHGYALAHPRLQQHMLTRIKTGRYREEVLAYCAKWQKHRSPYALAHYAQHLAEAGRAGDLQRLVKSRTWTRAKYVDTPWVTSLIQDLQLASEIVGGKDIQSWACSMGSQLRRAIIEKQMSLMSYNSILFLAKLGDVDRALEFARRHRGRQFELIREIARIAALVDPDKAVDILSQLAHSADNRSIFNQCTYRLAAAEEILQITSAFRDTALRLINEATDLEHEIPEPRLTSYKIDWKLPILALSGDLDTTMQLISDLSELQQAQALRCISLTLAPGNSAKQPLAEQGLSIVQLLEQTPEVIIEKMRAIVTLLPFVDDDEQEEFLRSIESIGDHLESIRKPKHYDLTQSWTIKRVAVVNLGWAKHMLLESGWTGTFGAWPEVVREIAKVDYEEALHLLSDRFGNYAWSSQVLADIIRLIAVEQDNLKEAEGLIGRYKEQLRHDLPEAYLALAEGYLVQGHRREAQKLFREQVFVIDNEVIDRTRGDLQLAILRRAGVFLSVEEANERLMVFHPDQREEKGEAELILAIMAAQQGKIAFLERHHYGRKGQPTIAYELAKQLGPEAAKEYAKSRVSKWSKEGREVYAHIAIEEAQRDPSKIDVLLEHFNADQPHHFCTYMVVLPLALEDLIWANSMELRQVKRIIEDIYPQLIDWNCPEENNPSDNCPTAERCDCYGERDRVLAHLIGIMARLDLDRAKQMAESLPDEPVKVNALKQILVHTKADAELVTEVVKATQASSDAAWQQAASHYELATLLPTTMLDQISDLIDLAEPLPGEKPPHQPELKLLKGEALMMLVNGVDELEKVEKSLEAVEGLLLLDTRGVGKLRVFDRLIERAIEWSEQDRLALLQYVRELAATRELLDVQAFIAFSVPFVYSLAGRKGFWHLYHQVEWAYQELPQLNKAT